MVPILHVGRPRNPCEWRAYDSRLIITAKDGKSLIPVADRKLRVIQHLRLRWWFGISSPKRPAWFLGLMRWERVTEPASEAEVDHG